MTTVYDAAGVVNQVRGYLGDGTATLYDWRRLWPRHGRNRRVDELSPPGQPRYEQLAGRLRRRIFGGEWPDGASGPFFADEYRVSQTAVQKAFEILEREGLVRMEFGRRTAVLPRKRWHVEFEVRLPGDDDARAAAVAKFTEGLERLADGHPAVSSASAGLSACGAVLAMTVESADSPEATVVAAGIARQATGALPIAAISAREA
jgi:hypothetical protein